MNYKIAETPRYFKFNGVAYFLIERPNHEKSEALYEKTGEEKDFYDAYYLKVVDGKISKTSKKTFERNWNLFVESKGLEFVAGETVDPINWITDNYHYAPDSGKIDRVISEKFASLVFPISPDENQNPQKITVTDNAVIYVEQWNSSVYTFKQENFTKKAGWSVKPSSRHVYKGDVYFSTRSHVEGEYIHYDDLLKANISGKVFDTLTEYANIVVTDDDPNYLWIEDYIYEKNGEYYIQAGFGLKDITIFFKLQNIEEWVTEGETPKTFFPTKWIKV